MNKYIGSEIIVDGITCGVKFENEKGVIIGADNLFFVIKFYITNPAFHDCQGRCPQKKGYYLPTDSDCIKILNYKSIW